MNKQQAMAAGYTFHGCYERAHNKDLVTARAKELRKQGNKAITVKIPDDRLSRGGGGHGYSIYWIESEENIAKREAEARSRKEANIKFRIAELKAQIAELEEELETI